MLYRRLLSRRTTWNGDKAVNYANTVLEKLMLHHLFLLHRLPSLVLHDVAWYLHRVFGASMPGFSSAR
jgi:hypothetical protein